MLGVSVLYSRGPFVWDARSESTNLYFLRSCAIFFLVLFHILLYFQHTSTLRGHLNLMPFGHFGVLIFFVHTSLVVLFSLERQDSRTPGAPLFTPFLIRRIFRIYPLSIPCCCACRTVSHPGWSPSRQAVPFRQPACHRHSFHHFSPSGSHPHGIRNRAALEFALRNALVSSSSVHLSPRKKVALSSSCRSSLDPCGHCRLGLSLR